MEEVAVSPMVVAAVVLNNNGADAVSSSDIPSVIKSLEEKDKINGDVPMITSATNNDEELFNVVESTKYNGHGSRMEMQCTTPVSSRSPSTRKKRGAFGLFRAMYRSFGGSDSMKKTRTNGDTTSPKKRAIASAVDDHKLAAGDESPSWWKSLVDGMRPLRLRGQELEYYPPPPPLGHADVYHEVILSPPSPGRSGFESEEVVGMTSRYASAEDLHQMEEDALAAEGGDDGDSSCPHAIDVKAEEFIAKFYEQFKSESFNGRASE